MSDRLRRLLLRYFRGRADFLDVLLFERSMRARGLGHVHDIPTWTWSNELRALHDLAAAAPPNATAVEIGSYLGASPCYLAAGLARHGGRIICVDTWNNETMPEGERDTFAEFTSNTRAVANRVSVVRKRTEMLGDGDIPAPIQLAFIDGDHGYEAVRRDFEIIAGRLAPTGVIAFHDFGNEKFPGVTRVVGEALATGGWIQRGFVRTLVWITPAAEVTA